MVLGLAVAAALGHDFWLEPVTTTSGARAAHLCVGEELAGDERALRADRALRAELVSAAGVLDLRPPEGVARLPAVLPPGAAPGLLVYASRASRVVLEADRFDAYLESEGLEAIRLARRMLGEERRPGRERYARAAKALVGPVDAALAGRVVGLRHELVLEADPRALRRGDWLTFRVLWEGAPLEGVWIRLLHRGVAEGSGRVLGSDVSDREGRASIRIEGSGELRPGLYLVKALHMVRAAPGDEAEWESVWASLSFAIPGPRR